MTPDRAAPPRARYAPSPSGALHLGNLRTALVAWLHCRLQGGVFIVRIDDLDTPRVRPGAEAAILADLRWLGLDWDEGPDVGGPAGPYRQSERLELYGQALEQLRRAGELFPCRCSRSMLAAISAPHGPAPIYPGSCRKSSDWQPRDGRIPSWRWRVPASRLDIVDGVLGPQQWNLPIQIGDVVLRRADGFIAYHLATAVDEVTMAITQVLRGADLLPSTPVQLALIRRLGGPGPRYWHVPLMRNAAGSRLAKRDGSAGLGAWRAAGFSAAEVVGRLLASLALTATGQAISAADALDSISLSALDRALFAAGSGSGTPPQP
ncbi:MAG: tRNA glutamyl-Q(34) synthetase GluQRS [Aphanocapsa feldmannii 288cV]|nr:MAG: tRNA glutamyl-Q(34) synthetase GluQRS [Aphanocapsa feldmannii 288cV]